MTQDLPFPQSTPQDSHEGHKCQCGHDDASMIELDARQIPHAIRHASIFGALDSIQPGFSMVLVAPHNPLPLLAQAQDRYNGGFDVEYLEEGPEDWRIKFTRK